MPGASEEKDAIREALAEFCFHLDDGRFAEVAALFSEDGTWDAPFGKITGRQAISHQVASMAARRAAQPDARDIHQVTNIIVTLDGERANVRSYWTVVHNTPQGPQVRVGGVSTDEMVKQAGKWLFRYRKTDRLIPP